MGERTADSELCSRDDVTCTSSPESHRLLDTEGKQVLFNNNTQPNNIHNRHMSSLEDKASETTLRMTSENTSDDIGSGREAKNGATQTTTKTKSDVTRCNDDSIKDDIRRQFRQHPMFTSTALSPSRPANFNLPHHLPTNLPPHLPLHHLQNHVLARHPAPKASFMISDILGHDDVKHTSKNSEKDKKFNYDEAEVLSASDCDNYDNDDVDVVNDGDADSTQSDDCAMGKQCIFCSCLFLHFDYTCK